MSSLAANYHSSMDSGSSSLYNKSFLYTDVSKFCFKKPNIASNFPSDNINSAIMSSLKGGEGGFIRNSIGFGLSTSEFIDRSIEFRQSLSPSLDSIIKINIEKLPNSIVLSSKKASQDGVRREFRKLTSDAELVELCIQGDKSVPRCNYGLRNCGNTCYLNSVLQCLLATGPLLRFIETHHRPAERCPYLARLAASNQRFCALCGLSQLLAEHRTATDTDIVSAGSLTPAYFVSNVKSIGPSLRPYQQEDAHEFLLGVLSHMEDGIVGCHERLSQETAETNAVRRIFGGISRSEVTCSVCHNVSSRNDHWYNLSLDITSTSNLHQCLLQYGRSESLAGQNAYKCGNCNQLRPASRKCTILQAPPILIIQFNRFSRHRKLDQHIAFPTSFNLRCYMTSPAGPSIIYRLFGTLNHEGQGCRSGHYIAYTKRNKQWYLHNDNSVSTSNEQCVLNQSPYLLFYELITFKGLSPGGEPMLAPSNAQLQTKASVDTVRGVQAAFKGSPMELSTSITPVTPAPWSSKLPPVSLDVSSIPLPNGSPPIEPKSNSEQAIRLKLIRSSPTKRTPIPLPKTVSADAGVEWVALTKEDFLAGRDPRLSVCRLAGKRKRKHRKHRSHTTSRHSRSPYR